VNRTDKVVNPASGRDRELFMIGNAHLDPVWLWRWTEGYQEARATLASAVALIAENPDYVFTLDQVVLLEWVKESDPQLFEQVQQCVAAGRLEIVGGWWVEPDCNMPNGESFTRQGLVAQRFLLENFGVTATVGCNVDPFGHNLMLPQILSKQGMTSYCFLRPAPHERRLPSSAFWWESPDGSRVLAYRIPHEYCGPSGDIAYHVEKEINQLSPDIDDAMVFYGVGNHGGGPTRENLRSIDELNRRGTFGRLTPSTPGRYFAHLREQDTPLPTWRSDLQMHAPGCYSAQSSIKALNRRSEQALLAAERFAVLAAHLAHTPYPAVELLHAWKQLLFNQFHDILPGSAIASAFTDAEGQHGEVQSIAARVTNRSVQNIARLVNVPSGDGTQPILVFNPHPWPLATTVEVEVTLHGDAVHIVDDNNAPITSQAIRPAATIAHVFGDRIRRRLAFDVSVPPMGHRLYRVIPNHHSAPGKYLHAGQHTLENEFLTVEIDPATGWLNRLTDKRTGVDLIAGSGDPHTVVTDDPSDTWGHRVISYIGEGKAFHPKRIRLIEQGPVRVTIRVESAFGNSQLAEEFTLTATDPILQVKVTLDWHEKCRLLKLRFPTNLDDPVATYEVPFGHLIRPTDSTEYPGQAWVDISGTVQNIPAGVTIINDAKYAYDVTGNNLGITAARSPVYAWHDPKDLEEDGIYDYQDQGRQHFTYQVVPHAGDWRQAEIPRRTVELLMAPTIMFESFHPGPLPAQASNVSIDDVHIQMTAVKAAEDDPTQLVLRAVETSGRPRRVEVSLPLLNRCITANFTAYEIKTFLVSADPDVPVVETDLIERTLHTEPPQ